MPRKQKTIRRTINFDGEGHRDTSFGEYLNLIYHVSDRKVKTTSAHGGSPAHQIEQIIKRRAWQEFSEEHAIYDTDREEVDEARKLIKADGNKIRPHESEGCIDHELIKIITNDKKILKKAKQSTDSAKEELRKLCGLKKKDKPIDWKKYFPKKLLEEKRKDNVWLDGLIRIITG